MKQLEFLLIFIFLHLFCREVVAEKLKKTRITIHKEIQRGRTWLSWCCLFTGSWVKNFESPNEPWWEYYTTEISKCSLLKELVYQHTHESKKSAYNLQPVNLRNHSEWSNPANGNNEQMKPETKEHIYTKQ